MEYKKLAWPEPRIQDNFLPKELFDALSNKIMSNTLPWFYDPIIVFKDEDLSTSPGQLIHVVYSDNTPQSSFYGDDIFTSIQKQLRIDLLLRVKMNLRLRLPNPHESEYHIDIKYLPKDLAVKYTTSIFYVNTCNGYTEFKDGTKIESVANRLVSFPLTTEHRGVTQTDEQGRYVINFNYFKMQDNQ